MDNPLEVIFRNMKASARIEGLIEQHVGKLKKLYPRIIWSRVTIEVPNKKTRTDDIPSVHIEIHVPGQSLVIKREHHAKTRHQKPDVDTALHDAFEAATVKLKTYKTRKNDAVKEHVRKGVEEAPESEA
jgi:ribosome-associated translation inhibitor RaiA